MDQALARWGSRVGEGSDGEGQPLLDYAAVAFGYRYRLGGGARRACRRAPGAAAAELTGQPGTRAPHVWLERDGQRLSTIDLFGRGFVLLTGAGRRAWVDAARSLTAPAWRPIASAATATSPTRMGAGPPPTA